MPIEPELLTAKEAANFLFTTENSLRSMRVRQFGPPFRKCGHHVRYARSELQTYIASLRPSDLTKRSLRQQRLKNERGAFDRQ